MPFSQECARPDADRETAEAARVKQAAIQEVSWLSPGLQLQREAQLAKGEATGIQL